MHAREFLAPVPLCGVAVMALNDFALKPAFHNALTGKLSDFAICFFLPLYLSALAGIALAAPARLRLFAGALATALVFAALKLSPAAAGAFTRAVAALVRPAGFGTLRAAADPTDLIALPMVLVALWYARRQLEAEPEGVNP